MPFGICVVVFYFVQTSTKNFLQPNFVMKCRFLLRLTYFFLQASQRFFQIAVNLRKRYCERGRTGLHFELRASECAD